ncbi:hypothetical protein JCM11491_004766 [Sporobolomyces phaffii]
MPTDRQPRAASAAAVKKMSPPQVERVEKKAAPTSATNNAPPAAAAKASSNKRAHPTYQEMILVRLLSNAPPAPAHEAQRLTVFSPQRLRILPSPFRGPASHGRQEAIEEEGDKGAASRPVIKKYILHRYGISDTHQFDSLIATAIRRGSENGTFDLPKGFAGKIKIGKDRAEHHKENAAPGPNTAKKSAVSGGTARTRILAKQTAAAATKSAKSKPKPKKTIATAAKSTTTKKDSTTPTTTAASRKKATAKSAPAAAKKGGKVTAPAPAAAKSKKTVAAKSVAKKPSAKAAGAKKTTSAKK